MISSFQLLSLTWLETALIDLRQPLWHFEISLHKRKCVARIMLLAGESSCHQVQGLCDSIFIFNWIFKQKVVNFFTASFNWLICVISRQVNSLLIVITSNKCVRSIDKKRINCQYAVWIVNFSLLKVWLSTKHIFKAKFVLNIEFVGCIWFDGVNKERIIRHQKD